MASVGRLCAARCNDLLQEAAGRELEEFHLDPRFLRASSGAIEAALSAESLHSTVEPLQTCDSSKRKLLPVPKPSWADGEEPTQPILKLPPITYSRLSVSSKKILENLDIIVRQDHEKVCLHR